MTNRTYTLYEITGAMGKAVVLCGYGLDGKPMPRELRRYIDALGSELEYDPADDGASGYDLAVEEMSKRMANSPI